MTNAELVALLREARGIVDLWVEHNVTDRDDGLLDRIDAALAKQEKEGS